MAGQNAPNAATRFTRDERAALIRIVEELRERCDAMLDLLLPDEPAGVEENGECPHDSDDIEDLSTMGEELYRCTRCGAEGESPLTLHPTEPLED